MRQTVVAKGVLRMFIHLGGEKIIRASELVAIFDVSVQSFSKTTKAFVSHATKEKKAEMIAGEEPKSLVVTVDKVYYSPVSSTTLKKRAQQPFSF